MRLRISTRCALLLALALVPCLAGAASGRERPRFVDVTAEAGVSYLQHALREPPECIFSLGSPGDFCEPERMTGGAAVGDVDGDGDPDLFVTRLDAPDILFRNRGDGSFEDATREAGLDGFDLQSNGAGFGDIDGDGDLDLYVTTLGDAGDPVNSRNYLFVNDGRGVFREEAVARGAAVESARSRRGYSVAFGDYDRDGYLDLHVTEWLPFVFSHSRLLRNRGEAAPGFFEDTTAAAGVDLERSDAFASTFTDLDDDGWPDLAVAADFGTSRLFWNRGDGGFDEGTAEAGVASDENGMGSTFGDFDGDGRLDWFVTSIFDADRTCEMVECNWGFTGNRLYRNEGGRVFSDATDSAGVREGYWGWGTAFLDYDNDGDLDLVMTNGVEFPGTEVEAAYNDDPMRFWENDGSGRMTEVSAEVGLTDTGSGKGLLVFDYDADGDLDLFVVNTGAAPRLYRNDGGNRGDWLRVQLLGAGANRSGLGARVSVIARDGASPQVREVGTGSHFLGQSETTAHFGLGRHRGRGGRHVAEVRVRWPSGQVQTFRHVRRNRTLVAREAAAHGCGSVDVGPLLLLLWRLRRLRG